MEVETDHGLPFLDTLVVRRGEHLFSEWYSKPTSSDRILNYNSYHPFSQKMGVACGVLNRAIRLSHQDNQHKSLDKANKLLQKNNYPPKIIKRCLEKTRKKLELTPSKPTRDGFYCRFPYIEGLSRGVGRCFDSTKCKLGYYNINRVRNIYSKLKDTTEQTKRSNVVYKIPCSCDKCYIGQTKQNYT